MKIRKLAVLAAILLLGAFSETIPSRAMETFDTKPRVLVGEQTTETKLEAAVNKWHSALSEMKGFESWKGATWQSYPLGPGTHGWVVHFSLGSRNVGYIVVHAIPDGGFQLSEYGLGDKPLFSSNTLYQSLVQQALIDPSLSASEALAQVHAERLYPHPMYALWKFTTGDQVMFADAKSGEILPIIESDLPAWSLSFGDRVHDELKAVQTGEMDGFDPYERFTWFRAPAPINRYTELQDLIAKSEQVTLVVMPYQDKVIMPMALTGYHQFAEGEPYMKLEQYGARYIPYSATIECGQYNLL